MKFIPYCDKIEVEPIKQDQVILSQEQSFEEMGIVVAIGDHVQGIFPELAIGDTLFFVSHGCWKTPEVEGKRHYLVSCDEEFILGYAKAE